ncbi:MAG TPA: hypothetical protein VK509_08435 [Polyangiales bacterium]|nr:hypothetical protein [Polyangiales bacterium]
MTFAGCSDDASARGDAAPPADGAARDSAIADAGPPTDGGTAGDGGMAPPLASWDGGAPPPVRWTLPECAVAHGVIARNVLDPDEDPNPQLRPLAVALRGERLVLAYLDGTGVWGEIEDEAFRAFEQPRGGSDWPLSAALLATDGTRVIALAYSPLDHVPLLITRTDDGLSTIALQSLAAGTGELSLNPRTELPNLGFIDLQAGADSTTQVVAEFIGSAAPQPEQYGVARVTLDAEGRVSGVPEWYASELDPQPGTAPAPEAFVQAGADSVVLLRHGGEPAASGARDVELVIHSGGAARNAPLGQQDAADRGIGSLSAALDSDALVLGWLSGARDSPWATEFTAEVALGSGELRRVEPIVAGVYDESGVRYLSHPGGGVDAIKWGDPAPGHVYDPRVRAQNPLAIYLGLQRPLRFDGEAPLRLGAGATVWHAVAARDGDRLAIIWLERGPATSELASEADTVQGLYYALLDCDR